MKRLLVLQHLEIEGPGLFEQLANEKDLKIKIIRLDKKDTWSAMKWFSVNVCSESAEIMESE